MKTLVFGNLLKLFRLAITFAREVYHLGIKMKINMTIGLFFSLSPTEKMIKMIKFNPGSSQIVSKVFLPKNT